MSPQVHTLPPVANFQMQEMHFGVKYHASPAMWQLVAMDLRTTRTHLCPPADSLRLTYSEIHMYQKYGKIFE